MSLFPLEFPDGIYRNGTEKQSQGRWYDANLVRFYDGTRRPIGGWEKKSTTAVTGSGRAIISWKDNSTTAWAAIGTHSHLYAMGKDGILYDITPAGFTSGRADAVAEGGYGGGSYGAGAYGTPRPDTTTIQDASVWTLDTWGQDMVGVMADDGIIYEWALDTGTAAAAVTNAPSARAVFVTEEGIMMALGASGNPRNAKWSDQRDNTNWTPSATNQAGDFDLQTAGKLMLGKRVRGGSLIFSDLDVFLAAYTADVLVYSFNKIGDSCGACSQTCVASLDSFAAWMGRNGFWLYNGFIEPLPCDVSDYVFSDINVEQISKVTCFVNAAFGEVTWYYPSSGSTENDRYVTWSYRAFSAGRSVWMIGQLARLSGTDRGAMLYPMLVGSDGYVYSHEIGFDYSGDTPYLESGPFSLGQDDYVMHATMLIPDEKTEGDVTATFKTKFYPNATETSYGPYTLASPTDIRFAGRQAKVRYIGARLADWRIGSPKIDLIQGGQR